MPKQVANILWTMSPRKNNMYALLQETGNIIVSTGMPRFVLHSPLLNFTNVAYFTHWKQNLHQHKDKVTLYCNTRFTVVVCL